jgi:hypothetical protein
VLDGEVRAVADGVIKDADTIDPKFPATAQIWFGGGTVLMPGRRRRLLPQGSRHLSICHWTAIR